MNGVAVPDSVGTVDQIPSIKKFCGTSEMTVAYVDSNAGVNSWRKITKAQMTDEAAQCPNIKMVFSDGQGSLQKTISDIQGFAAQGVNAMVVLSDFGDPTMPAVRQAMRAGIPVSLINYPNPQGEKGRDYVATLNGDDKLVAQVQTEWLIKQIGTGGSCNILHVGGSAGNPLSAAVSEGIKAALQNHPQCKLLNDEPLTTDWNPADEQKAVAGALVQFPQIDAVYNECGTCAPGGWQAFVQANRPLVPWVSDDVNQLACLYQQLKPQNPKFQMLTVSARNFLGRLALQKTVAAANKMDTNTPDFWLLPVFEDSTNPSQQPQCDPEAPPAAIWSATLNPGGGLTKDQITKAVS